MYKEKILLPGDFSQQRELENRCSFHGFLHLDLFFLVFRGMKTVKGGQESDIYLQGLQPVALTVIPNLFLIPGTHFMEDNFPTDQDWAGMVSE